MRRRTPPRPSGNRRGRGHPRSAPIYTGVSGRRRRLTARALLAALTLAVAVAAMVYGAMRLLGW